ncbi:MAG: hypothetical protein ISR82_04090, partial [Candidatus Marinimicrobia bacterium]|nr:hypothetical protein [Candidatus Neomarinimicrobiota bacterium]MBL7010382.1 hypothetical protein [Candidatus Neomarinimicrobiota bacterium]
VANGDIELGGFSLKDSEFLLAFDKNVSSWQGASYEDDQDLILKFDLWANGKVSPFMMFETSFDKLQGIKNRTNYGIGAKWRVIGDLFSISAAFLNESEETISKSSIYVYTYWSGGDSLYVSDIKDNTELKPKTFSRLSIRPKLKLPIGENFYYESQYYYKPAGDDVLTHWINKFTVKTKAEWLDIVISYRIKNDNLPAPKIFRMYDTADSWRPSSITFDNNGEGSPIPYDKDPTQSAKDGLGDYYIQNYKKNDSTLSIGINISF